MRRELVRPAASAERFADLVRQLDAADAATRRRATAELAKLGPAAGPLLRESLSRAKSAEARRRLRGVPGRVPADIRRGRRARSVLRRIDTAAARRLLRELTEAK